LLARVADCRIRTFFVGFKSGHLGPDLDPILDLDPYKKDLSKIFGVEKCCEDIKIYVNF
jgi:hypothetical protein